MSKTNISCVQYQKIYLNDIVVMRLVLIFMLIVYHSFAPFCGGWQALDENSSTIAYFWIGKFSYSFFLEAFVFISGLIAGFQATKRPISEQGYKYLLKKFKRLIVPSIVFSLIYFLCFNDWNGVPSFAISILQGCGHMWFLPMLFWCFVGLYSLRFINIHPYVTLIFSIILMLVSNGSIPLRIGNAMYYFIFFYLGYLIYKENFLRSFLSKHYPIFLLIIVFILSVVLNVYYPDAISYKNFINSHIICVIINHMVRGIIGFSGLMSLYMIISMFIKQDTKIPGPLVILSKYSFGIYIMQQFILKALYYHTSLPILIDIRIVPWIGLLCSIIFSIITTHFFLKFKLGKFLLG